jgi:hypothetical protein
MKHGLDTRYIFALDANLVGSIGKAFMALENHLEAAWKVVGADLRQRFISPACLKRSTFQPFNHNNTFALCSSRHS